LFLALLSAGCGAASPAGPSSELGVAAIAGFGTTTWLFGSDSLDTAVVIAQFLYPGGASTRPDVFILVPVDDQAATLVGASLTGVCGGPLLFTESATLPARTQAELSRSRSRGLMLDGRNQIILVGDVPDTLLRGLSRIGYHRVRRLRHPSARGPAAVAAAADRYRQALFPSRGTPIVVASLDGLAHAMPAVAWLAHHPGRLLYVTRHTVPVPTRERLSRDGGDMFLVGPESVASPQVERQLGAYGRVQRIAQAGDPFQASVQLAAAPRQPGPGWEVSGPGNVFVFAGADTWRDAALGATLSRGRAAGPLLLVQPAQLPPSVAEFLERVGPGPDPDARLNFGFIVGDPSALGTTLQQLIDSRLNPRAWQASPTLESVIR
jgi:hypothetical protein